MEILLSEHLFGSKWVKEGEGTFCANLEAVDTS